MVTPPLFNMDANICNLQEHKLEKLSLAIKEEIATAQSSWRRIGLLLSEARAEFPGDREYGQWCKAQGFGLNRQALLRFRTAADFAATHVSQQIPNDYHLLTKAATKPPELQQEILARWEKGECLTRSEFEKEYVKATPQKGTAKIAKLNDEVAQMRQALPPKSQALLDKEIAKLREVFTEEVNKKARELAEAKVPGLKEQQQKAIDAELRYTALVQDFSTFMTYEEFRVIRSCLHPDRTDADKAKLANAFAVFNKLERAVNKNIPIAELRKRGWAHVSPFYKGK